MPNTLAHIGINGFLTKSLIKKSDFSWILLGTIIPDFPWILNKAVQVIFPSIIGYDFHAYLIAQASLVYSLILAGSISLFSKSVGRTFIILSIGSLFHLLLDSLQIKWANGVHLFAPYTWELFHYGLFWPESFWTYIITLSGLLFIILNFKELKYSKIDLEFSKSLVIFSLALLLIYFITPLYFITDIEKEDCHYIGTLKQYESRVGKYVEMDRKRVTFNESTNSFWIESFDNSLIQITGVNNLKSSKLSIRGYFLSNNLIKVSEYHENWEEFRDGSSYAGITIIFLFMVYLSFRSKKQNRAKEI